MVSKRIKGIINKYRNLLEEKGVHVSGIILFGSYAMGKVHKDTDIDIAVISPDFGKDRVEEGQKLFRNAWRVDSRIEPIPISAESWKREKLDPLISEIKVKGIMITGTK